MRISLVAAAALVGGMTGLALAQAQEVDVHDVWARASIGQVKNSAAYFSVTNRGEVPDRLVSVESSAVERAELHDHIMEDDVARMVEVETIDLDAGETLTLEPGGLHIMLFGLSEPLAPGDSLPLTLHFEQAGSLEVEADVRPLRGGGHGHDHDHGHNHGHGHDHGDHHEDQHHDH